MTVDDLAARLATLRKKGYGGSSVFIAEGMEGEAISLLTLVRVSESRIEEPVEGVMYASDTGETTTKHPDVVLHT